MQEQHFQSVEVESVLGMKASTLRFYADRLPVTRHHRQGQRRLWSPKDIATIYIATTLADRGVTQTLALDLAAAAEKRFVDVMVDQEEKGATYFVAARHRPDRLGRFPTLVTSNAEEALAFVKGEDPEGVTIFNLTKLLTEAWLLILAHAKAQKGRADG